MRKLTWRGHKPNHHTIDIHGVFNRDDILWLHHMQPKGQFIPTFYSSALYGTKRTLDNILNYLNDHGEAPFYYWFRNDRRGITLLTALKLKGLTIRE